MIKNFVSGKVFVFIDAANLEQSVKSLGWKVNYRKLLAYLKAECNLKRIAYYTVSFAGEPYKMFLNSLRAKSYSVITKPLKVINDKKKGKIRKANFDVEISVEAVDLIKEYETMILFSGDSDFDFLIRYLKNKNKKIIVVSATNHIARELIRNAHKYFDLKKFKEIFSR